MDRFTRDFIYALKRNECGSLKKTAIKFMASHTLSQPEVYTPFVLKSIARQKFVDFLSTADRPSAIVSHYFYEQDEPWNEDDTEALLTTLSMVQVKEGDKYINGFWEDEQQSEDLENQS